MNSGHIYTYEEYLEYGSRLHINTIIDICVNALAAYVIIWHSTKAMSTYKYFILLTIFCGWFLDFYLTLLYGPFVLLPTPIVCGASFISQRLDYFWGHVIPYAILHVCLSAVGGSLIYSLLYQYYSLCGSAKFLHSFYGILAFCVLLIAYPIPSYSIIFAYFDYPASLLYVEKSFPNCLELYKRAPCYTIVKGERAQQLTMIGLIFGVACIGGFMGLKIHWKLSELKQTLSTATLKARKQFLLALILQLAVPSIFIIIPLIATLIGVILNLIEMNVFSGYLMFIIGFHSTANACTVMYVITPYRQAIIRWAHKILPSKPEVPRVLSRHNSHSPSISVTNNL